MKILCRRIRRKWRRSFRCVLTVAAVLAHLALSLQSAAFADMTKPLQSRIPFELVQSLFPAADGVGPVAGTPPMASVTTGEKTIGYVFSTHETVRPGGFSGASFDIIVGLDTNGVIVGHRTLEEHEPFVADNMVPLANIDKFVSRLHGTSIRSIRQYQPTSVDAVTGATISAKAFASGVANAATVVGYRLGMFDDAQGGLSVARYGFDIRTWADLIEDGSVRELSLTYRDVREAFARQLGPAAEPDIARGADGDRFITLYVALATPPTIGANLIGQRTYQEMTQAANPRAHHIVVMSMGPYDWEPATPWISPTVSSISIVQNSGSLPQLAAKFDPFARVDAEGAPPVNKVARFSLSPWFEFNGTEPWTLKLHVKEKALPGTPQRRVDFELPYRIPAAYVEGSVFALEEAGFREPAYVAFGLLRESTLTDWQRTWVDKRFDIIALLALLGAVSFVVLWPAKVSRSERRWQVVRYGLLTLTLVWLGWIAGNQLTIVSVVNYARVLFTDLTWATILLDPLLLILSAYVVASLLLWGRGVFCGWLCPFGALQELLNKLAVMLRVPQVRVPENLQRRLWLVKYAIAALIAGLAVFSLPYASIAMEVEPFKTAITAKFDRSWPYVLYAGVLLLAGLFIERFFCRYLCPLGATLAVAGKLRLLNPLKRRAECGSPCRLCERTCPIDAIAKSGDINMTECFYCLDCQVLYYDEHTCPPLVAARQRRTREEESGYQHAG